MSTLAINGGDPVRKTPFAAWPVFDENEEEAILRVLRSGKWWRGAFGQGMDLAEPEHGARGEVVAFEEEFAKHCPD